ncbi:MAG: 2OG-Fe(II) oxygenase [Planctomycetota bacterium]
MKSNDIQQLIDCISAVKKKNTAFCASDQIDFEIANGAIQIEGIGPLKLPMRPKDVRELLAHAQSAPYGKGTRTIVDPTVRDSLEINASCLAYSEQWKSAIEQTARRVAKELNLPPDRIKAEPYKLLIYTKGGFFLPHRDSEKRKSMVASLIVMLPSRFGGGDLSVEHESKRQRFDFKQSRDQVACDCASFYADCLHEVKKVTSGVRICLSYNLSLKAPPKSKTKTSKTDPVAPLVAAIKNWTRSRPAKPLVFAMEHQYTASGLKPDLLKGKDRTMAKQLIAAAEKADCQLHFGQVERHLVEHAVDGYSNYDGYRGGRFRGHSRRRTITDPSDLEILSVIEETVCIDGWKSAEGKRVQMEALAVGGDALVSKTPLEDWKPTSFDYEGYTGNAGNTLDRWYHKSAITIWAKTDHFRILVQMGTKSSIIQFLKQHEKHLKRKLPDQELHDDQVQFARAIINGWPNRLYLLGGAESKGATHLRKFALALPQLNNLGLLNEFLQTVAVRDWSISLDGLIRASAKQFPIEELTHVLSRYLKTVPAPNEYGRTMASGLPLRDANWLLKLANLKSRAGFSAEQLWQFGRQMIGRVGNKVNELSQEHHPNVRLIADVLPQLMKAAIAVGDDAWFAECYGVREKAADLLSVRDFDAIVCRELIHLSDKKFDQRLNSLSNWLQKVREFLERATEVGPRKPTDFARPEKVSCNCHDCEQLSAFLAAAREKVGEIKTRKFQCEHVQQIISRDELDVIGTIDRSTRPFTLRLKKTIDSFQRAKAQYKADLDLLASLPEQLS